MGPIRCSGSATRTMLRTKRNTPRGLIPYSCVKLEMDSLFKNNNNNLKKKQTEERRKCGVVTVIQHAFHLRIQLNLPYFINCHHKYGSIIGR
jgi:hypothetical protein